jgi:hypothetical protein
MVEFPHENFILFLFQQGKSRLEVSQVLIENELAIPPSDFLDKLASNVVSSNTELLDINKDIEDMPVNTRKGIDELTLKAIGLLDHKDRELLDVLCILNNTNLYELSKDCQNFGISGEPKVIERYLYLFWNSEVLNSRKYWRRFINCLENKDLQNTYKLANSGDRGYVIWKMGKSKNFEFNKDIISNSIELCYRKLMECRISTINEVDNSKVAANWGMQLNSFISKLHEVESESQYESFLEALKKNVSLKTLPLTHPTLEEITNGKELADENKVTNQ